MFKNLSRSGTVKCCDDSLFHTTQLTRSTVFPNVQWSIRKRKQKNGTTVLSKNIWKHKHPHLLNITFQNPHCSDCCIAVRIVFSHSLVFKLEGRDWQEPEPSHVTGMALTHCIQGKFLWVVYHCFPPPLHVPTLAARFLRPQRRERS